MEFNGFKIDLTLCKELDERFCKEIKCINDSLEHYYPHPDFNSGSNHQLSCLLFGGTYEYVCQVPTARTLKSGAIKTGFKKGTGKIPLTGMFKPKRDWEYKATKDKSDYDLYLENQRRAADGKQLLQRIYSTDYEVMQSLKSQAKSREAKAFIDMLLRKAYLEKLQSTYFGGYPKLVEQYGWSDERIHGQFNQTIAITGRLSSSNPNLQNIAKEVKQVFRSEY
jgi:DNA polymerase I-like protein with 3'-5' exonuclease and polymerase domains